MRRWLLPLLGQAAAPAEPCEGSFYNPSTREDEDALGLIRPLDDLDRPVSRSSRGLAKFVARVVAIDKDIAQPREALPYGFEEIDRAISVLNVGGVHEDKDKKAAGIGQDVALAAFDLFASIIAARTAAFGSFHGLAVDHAGAWRGPAPLDLPQVHDQNRVNRLDKTSVAPCTK